MIKARNGKRALLPMAGVAAPGVRKFAAQASSWATTPSQGLPLAVSTQAALLTISGKVRPKVRGMPLSLAVRCLWRSEQPTSPPTAPDLIVLPALLRMVVQ